MDDQKVLTIIGGGVIGISLSIALKKKYPNSDVFVLEKEKFLFDHSSSRNSGVLHSGLYYPKGSLKHRLCMKGIELWKEFCKDQNLEVYQTGKYIVSIEDDKKINSLYENAQKNGLEGVKWVEGADLKNLNEKVKARKAFYIPSTASINV